MDEWPVPQGSDHLWSALAWELRPRLTKVVNALIRTTIRRNENPGYAEDIVSEALTAAYQKRRSYDPQRGGLYRWLLQIAKNRALDFLRRHDELTSEWPFDEDLDHLSPPPEEDRFLQDGAAPLDPRTLALHRALDRLKSRDREILIGRFCSALDYDDLERYFNFAVKRSTLRVHVMRAQERLRRELAKEPAFETLFAGAAGGRGRDRLHGRPPAQIPACAASAPGSCLGW